MVRGAAAQDLDPADAARLARVQVQAAQVHGVEAVVDPAAQHAVDRVGLLGDLLVHVGVVTAHVVGGGLPLHGLRGGGGGGATGGVGAEVVGLEGGHLAVVEGDDLAGVGDQRGDVRGDEHLLLADAQDHRGAVAGDDDAVGEVGVHDGDAVRALDLLDGLADLVLQGLGLGAGDQVDDDLGVGLRDEDGALGLELHAQLGSVVDDAVVDDGDLVLGVEVRVRVDVARRAVGGPAGVGDAGGAGEALGDAGLQLADATLGLDHLEGGGLRAVHDDARGVVPAVLKALQTLQQQRCHVTLADVTDDSAHTV